ncbi:MAG: RNA-binding protein [Devosia marina]|uniref:RNA-binding protein n=1 Tax=Devosia marina TaxID=2683198 RepID=UPI0032EE03FB
MADSKRKRPRDPNQLAKRIVDLATGEETEPQPDEIAVARGKKGGPARANKLTPEQRSEIARIAATARWRKKAD